MTGSNFLRTYVLRAGPAHGGGFQIGNIHNSVEETLHVSFSIEKSDVESPNTAKVQIWNLSDVNLRLLEAENAVLELSAGYGKNMALVLVGNIVSVITTKDNADRMTELEVVDGMAELGDAYVSLSLNGTVNSRAVYGMVADKMGVPVSFAGELYFPNLPNGFCYVGKAKNALHKLACCCRHSWTMQNKVLQVTWPGRPLNTLGYLLNSDTGLLGTPKRIIVGGGNSTRSGWEIVYLMNGAIGVNDYIRVESSTANGYYRVHKVTIDGDNLEGDWICTAQVLEVTAIPRLDRKVIQSMANNGQPAARISSEIKKGDKVRVIRTIKQGNKKKGYQYSGKTFVCWYDIYDVIQIKGDRAVIGIGKTVTAAVNKKDLAKV